MCEAVTKEMMQVRKKECCCTAGKAWGTDCQLCPRRGTGNYRPSSAFIFVIFHIGHFCLQICKLELFFFSAVEYGNLCQKIAQVKKNMTSKYCSSLNLENLLVLGGRVLLAQHVVLDFV